MGRIVHTRDALPAVLPVNFLLEESGAEALPKLVGIRALARCDLPTVSITPVTVSLTIKAQPAR